MREGLHRVVGRHAVVAAVRDGDEATAHVGGFGDCQLHRCGSAGRAKADIVVQKRGAGGLVEHSSSRRSVDAAVPQTRYVGPVVGEHVDAVRVDAAQVGVDQGIRGAGRIITFYTETGHDTRHVRA